MLSLSCCKTFPSVKKAKKRLIQNITVNSDQTEASVRYVCKNGYFYSLKNQILKCTEKGFGNEIGKCVKGNMFLVFILLFR